MQWKESIIVSIYKKGDKTDCSKYRRVSILSATYKILSKILLSTLTPYTKEAAGLINGNFDEKIQLRIM